jgi:hypothetical protein
LSERSDALVLVVSEERGTVSIAQEGQLDIVDAAELNTRLNEFSITRFPRPVSGGRAWKLLENWRWKSLAVALASLAWLLFAYQPGVVERTFVVPFEYRNVPANVMLDGTEPAEARIMLSGRETDFSMLDPAALKVSLDLNKASSGVDEFPVRPQDVDRPLNLEVKHIEPATVRIRLADTNTNAPAHSVEQKPAMAPRTVTRG